MNKVVISLMSVLFVIAFGFTAYAATPGTPEYDEMKKIKAEQRARREELRRNPAPEPPPGSTFWDREAQRSGFAKSGMPLFAGMRKMNPVPFLKRKGHEYNTRKYGAVSMPAAAEAVSNSTASATT